VMEDDTPIFVDVVSSKPVMYPMVMNVLPLEDPEVAKNFATEFGLEIAEPWPILLAEGPVETGYYERYEPEERLYRPWNCRPISDVPGGLETAKILCAASLKRINDSLYDQLVDLYYAEWTTFQVGSNLGEYPPADLESLDPDAVEYWECIDRALKAGLIMVRQANPFVWTETDREVLIGPMENYLRENPAAYAYWEDFEAWARIAALNALRTVSMKDRGTYFWEERYFDPWVSSQLLRG